MSGVDSTLIAVASITVASAWLVLALKPWRHPQHAARYRPDPVTPPAFEDTVTFAQVEGHPPWDIEAEVQALAAHGELVFGTAGAMGCDSGAMAAVRDGAGLEDTLRRELALVDDLDLSRPGPAGEEGPVLPPAGSAGARGESEGSGPAAPPAPVPCPECGEDPCWLAELFGEEQ